MTIASACDEIGARVVWHFVDMAREYKQLRTSFAMVESHRDRSAGTPRAGLKVAQVQSEPSS